MNRKYMALLLVALLLPCCIAVPARAAIDTKDVMQNLFVTTGFDTYLGTSLVAEDSSSSTVSGSGYTYGFAWEVANNLNSSSVVLTIRSADIPDSVILNLDGSDYIEYAPASANGYVRQYQFDIAAVSFSAVNVQVNYSTSSYRDVTLTSAVAYADYSSAVESVLYNFNCDYIGLTDGNIVRDTISSGNVSSFPFHCNLMHMEGLNSYKLVGGQVDMYFTVENLGYAAADRLSLMMYATGTTESFGASLIDLKTGGTVAILDCVYTFAESETVLHFNDTDVPYSWYQIDIDLSGYDLSKYQLLVSAWVDEYDFSGLTVPTHGVEFGFIGAAVVPLVESLPWYTVLFRWFGDQFNSLKDTVATWGQNIVDAFSPDSGAADQVVNDAVSKGDQIGGLNDQMNSVEKPDLSGSGDISGIISPGDMSTSTTFLTTVVNAPYIGQVIMLSLILSLAAYVLFGKRS